VEKGETPFRNIPVKREGKEVAPTRAKEVRPDRVISFEEKDFKDF
jgi:hypothetical protein